MQILLIQPAQILALECFQDARQSAAIQLVRRLTEDSHEEERRETKEIRRNFDASAETGVRIRCAVFIVVVGFLATMFVEIIKMITMFGKFLQVHIRKGEEADGFQTGFSQTRPKFFGYLTYAMECMAKAMRLFIRREDAAGKIEKFV